MQRTIIVILGVLAAGLLGAGYFASSSEGQVRRTSLLDTQACSVWPPKPQDIVNLDGSVTFSGIPNEVIPVYTVPPDKWLIVTNVEFYSQPGYMFDFVERVSMSTVTVKRGSHFLGSWYDTAGTTSGRGGPYMSSIGIAFLPGSDVAFAGSTVAPMTKYYSVTGYLADI